MEMKKVYRDLQKAHMKQLKSERSSHMTEKELDRSKKTGFVANCLLKVACSNEGGADVKQLKVKLKKRDSSVHIYTLIVVHFSFFF